MKTVKIVFLEDMDVNAAVRHWVCSSQTLVLQQLDNGVADVRVVVPRRGEGCAISYLFNK